MLPKIHYFPPDDKWYSKASIVRRLKSNGLDLKTYYDEHYKVEGEGICHNPSCKKEIPFVKFSYRKFCDIKCAAAVNQNWKNIYSSESDPNRREKTIQKQLLLRKDPIKELARSKKRMETVAKNVGMPYADYMRIQMQSRFDSMTDDERIVHFDKATKKKNCFKYHPYVLNGETIRTQGYEKYILDVLVKIFPSELIIVDDTNRKIYYDFDGKVKRYYPDIIVGNFLFEVKSTYTYALHRDMTDAKLNSAKQNGYVTFLVIWDIKQHETCEKDLIEAISSQSSRWGSRFNDYPLVGVEHKHMMLEALDALTGR